LIKSITGGEIGRIDYRNRRETIQVEAKEMEKQKIIDTFNYLDNYCTGLTAEQYYNEVFKQQEQ
jgi:hypothetical protein